MIHSHVKQDRLIEHKSDGWKSFFSNWIPFSFSQCAQPCLPLCEFSASVCSHTCCIAAFPSQLWHFAANLIQLTIGTGPICLLWQGECSTTCYCHVPYPPLKSLSSSQPRVQESQSTQKHNFVFFQTLLPLLSQTNRIWPIFCLP